MSTVIKVGGSLGADPDRRRRLLSDIAEGKHGACVVVPGGGGFAEAVRARQGREGFDDATAHRLALDAMGRTASLFRAIEPRLVRTVAPWDEGQSAGARIWDPAALRAGHPDIPETWDVTSDSLALWLAARLRARRCVLVKAADAAPGADLAALARLGLVDAAAPAFAARFPGAVELWGPSGPAALPRRAAA